MVQSNLPYTPLLAVWVVPAPPRSFPVCLPRVGQSVWARKLAVLSRGTNTAVQTNRLRVMSDCMAFGKICFPLCRRTDGRTVRAEGLRNTPRSWGRELNTRTSPTGWIRFGKKRELVTYVPNSSRQFGSEQVALATNCSASVELDMNAHGRTMPQLVSVRTSGASWTDWPTYAAPPQCCTCARPSRSNY